MGLGRFGIIFTHRLTLLLGRIIQKQTLRGIGHDPPRCQVNRRHAGQGEGQQNGCFQVGAVDFQQVP